MHQGNIGNGGHSGSDSKDGQEEGRGGGGGGGGGRYRLQDALLRILAILKVKTKFHHGFAYYARSSEFADLPSRKLGEQQNTQDKTSHI